MPTPIIVIELFNNSFEALYSNTDVSFVIVNRSDDDNLAGISGPYAATLETNNLTDVIDRFKIPDSYLSTPGKQPFFVITDEEELWAIGSLVEEEEDDDDDPQPAPYFPKNRT
jgi:hypothetical protein